MISPNGDHRGNAIYFVDCTYFNYFYGVRPLNPIYDAIY